ncbi:uncharacterized protein LOC120132587 [Hibiscus syriacus]|uniref:uncharacterized protein LOC120132587 n=1 Tax=Hibiscus syriacus TaxID=106335 RepID=UPI00192148B0|nr:uncharacterized protein LOC120132587 [Hibiscus syriacus]
MNGLGNSYLETELPPPLPLPGNFEPTRLDHVLLRSDRISICVSFSFHVETNFDRGSSVRSLDKVDVTFSDSVSSAFVEDLTYMVWVGISVVLGTHSSGCDRTRGVCMNICI